MSAEPKTKTPIIEVTVEGANTLGDIVKWASLAKGLCIADNAVVSIDGVYQRLSVRAFITGTTIPEDVE